MYHHEHNDDYKFILMWFLDIADEVHDLTHEQNNGDVKGISSVCDLVGYMLRSFSTFHLYVIHLTIQYIRSSY